MDLAHISSSFNGTLFIFRYTCEAGWRVGKEWIPGYQWVSGTYCRLWCPTMTRVQNPTTGFLKKIGIKKSYSLFLKTSFFFLKFLTTVFQLLQYSSGSPTTLPSAHHILNYLQVFENRARGSASIGAARRQNH